MASSSLKNNSEDIEILVSRIKQGDHNSFAKLYENFIDSIFRYVYFRVNKEDVEDIVESVFLKVWENIKKYKKTKKSTFSSWIFRIAHNLVVDYYRSNKIKNTDQLDINAPDYKREHNPIRTTEDVITSDILRESILKLNKSYQDVLIYKFVNNFDNDEISRMLKKSEGSLRILQFRALKALRFELENSGFDLSDFM